MKGETRGKREGERGSTEMQIFARKLITRINSSQNIQTGCQTVRLHTPPPTASQTPRIPDATAVHTFAGVIRTPTDTMRVLLVHDGILCTGGLITNGFAERFYFATHDQKSPAILLTTENRIDFEP